MGLLLSVVFLMGRFVHVGSVEQYFEPTNYTRRIVGFDTFQGFPSVSERDQPLLGESNNVGDLRGRDFDNAITKVNLERHLGHIPNIELIVGDFAETGHVYLESNPHILVSLLYLDFDLYEPTKKALSLFLPRMSKGAIVCFDQANCPNFPGETAALLESLPLSKIELRRYSIDPWISYVKL